MKHYSVTFTTKEHLQEYITLNKISDCKNVLIQVFTAKNDIEYIKSLQKTVNELLPYAQLIGSTTDGEINTQGIQENSTIFSFSLFEQTKIKVTLVDGTNYCSEELGKKVVESFDSKDVENAKVAFSFTDGLNTNGEKYLQGINQKKKNLVVAGGMAGDRSTFTNTYVFTRDLITKNGAVMALLVNPELFYCTDYSFDWEAVGPKHKVTKSKDNIVYTIGDMTAVEFYKKYLGKEVAAALPAIGIEFPLITHTSEMEVARAVIKKNDDGSLVFAGNVPEGSVVTFGFGNVQKIVYNGSKTIKNILSTSIEGIYIYSCMARKNLLGSDINIELHPLSTIANVAGFFTYGEFFSDKKQNYLLNQSMTILALTETSIENFYCKPQREEPPREGILKNSDNVLRLEALSSLITQTSKDFDQLNENLNKRVQEELQKNTEKDIILQENAKHAQLGEMMEMILHQWRQPLSAMKTIITGAQMEQEYGMMTEEKIQLNRDNLLKNIDHLNQTVQDFRDFFKNTNESEHIQPSKILDKVQLFIYPLCKKENIKLNTHVSGDDTVTIDSSKLVQVIMNLVKNSIDALIENNVKEKKIDAVIKQDGDTLLITVSDNGGGIPDEILPRIFEKRFTTKKGSSGTGLGLYMTKTIIESHLKGEVKVSNVNKGVEFTIKISLKT